MARILVVDDDPDILLFLQVTLRGAGHEVATCSRPQNAVQLLRQSRYAAVVLDVNMPEMSGFEVLQAIRQEVGPGVPVLMLSSAADASDRVRGLQEGADDYLAKPWNPEELRLRIERLVAKAAPPAGELAGDLATYPLWEVLQSLERGEQTGVLELAVPESQAVRLEGGGRAAAIRLEGGRLAAAALGALSGEEAVLAALSLRSGSFRFRHEELPPVWIENDEPMVQIATLLMRHAWQVDELEVRRGSLPSAFQPLTLAAGAPLPAELESLPIQRLLARLQGAPAPLSLAALDGQGIAAPLTLRLMVARLVEAGVVAPAAGAPEADRGSDPDLDAALDRLFVAVPAKVLHLLLLAEPEVWESMYSLVAALPERDEEDRGRRRQLAAQRGGSLDLRHPRGQLALHLQVLAAGTRRQAESVLPLCQGVVLWLHAAPGPEVASLIERVETSAGVRVGLLIGDEAAAEAVRPLLTGPRWRLLTREPPSLAAVLGLLG